MDRRNFSVESLASNESFIDWVHQSDPEAVKYWDLYLASHPDIRENAQKARALVLNLKAAQGQDNASEQVDALWNKLQQRVEAPHKPTKPAPRTLHPLAILTTCMLVCVLSTFGVLFLRQHNDQPVPNYHNEHLADYSEQINYSEVPMQISLEDGTVVMLEGHSRLKYKYTFSKDSARHVYLLGKAHFDVAKNPHKPFIVHSNEIVARVLGTSFRVDSPEDGDAIVVAVKTGQVSVFAIAGNTPANHRQGGIVLSPNQQVAYKRKDRSFEKTLIESPALLPTTAIKPNDFHFDNTPIAKVFKTIESAYGLEIIFNDEVMKNCYLTAPLGAESLQDKLKIICETIGASYETIDAKIIITSPGCQ